MLVFFRLSKAGYGAVAEIENWDARKVIQALYYEEFWYDYEAAMMEMAKNDNS